MAEEREPARAPVEPALDETIERRPDSAGPDSAGLDSAGRDWADVLEAIQELSARVGGIQEELNALRSQARPLPEEGGEPAGWDGRPDRARDTFAWVRDLEGPRSRVARVPWLLLEIAFLAAVAVGLAIADVGWVAIVPAMAGAWVLVALAEWSGARAARQRAAAAYAPISGYGEPFASDPSWFAPPSEGTVLDVRDEDTGTRLPPPSAA